jgi:Tol biopolymer transport system component
MALSVGQTLGPYHVIAKLGEGGMGEVYRARDTTLNRDVAIKVLPPGVATDPDRLARFRREAELLASLNHPNIAHVYGVETSSAGALSDSRRALVMEFVDGQTLDELIADRPLPFADALPIARQIADALEAAHERGIVHRDLKPANIKITERGVVKVLDFGLAKAIGPDLATSNAEMADSPTITARATQLGVILGTAAYMAPEQAKGRPVDRRADIWAFGAVLFEMLSGRRAFGGDDVTEVMAAVIKSEPHWEALPATTPPAFKRLLRRCLEKDPKRRLRDIADGMLQLDEDLAQDAAPVIRTSPRPSSGLVWWAIAVAAALGAAGFFVGQGTRRTTAVISAPLRFQLPYVYPSLGTGGVSVGALSPSGTHHAYVAPEGDVQWLYIRTLENGETRRVPGSEDAQMPFWAPDSKRIAFLAGNRLMRTDVSAQLAIPIAPISTAPRLTPRGGSWGTDDMLIFVTGPGGRLRRVHATGGEVATVLPGQGGGALDAGPRYPEFLPDGHRFLYLARDSVNGNDAVFLSDLHGTAPRKVLDDSSSFKFLPGTGLLFVRENRLLLQRMEMSTLQLLGDPIAVADDVDVAPDTGAAQFTASETRLLFRDRSGGLRFQWADAAGRRMAPIDSEPIRTGPHVGVSVAPSGDLLAATRVGPDDPYRDIWLLNLQTANLHRLTSSPEPEGWPCWDREGKRLAFPQQNQLVVVQVGVSEELRLPVDVPRSARRCAWVDDHRLIVAHQGGMAVVHLDGKVEPISGPRRVSSLHVSADGELVVFASDTGRRDLFVMSLADPRRLEPISSDGGRAARWSPSGRDLFFISGTRAWKTTIGADLKSTAPVDLGWELATATDVITGFDITRDGRFLLALTDRRSTLTGIQDWQSLLVPSR